MRMRVTAENYGQSKGFGRLLAAWWRNFRTDPWDLLPLREVSSRYRLAWIVVFTTMTFACIAALIFGNLPGDSTLLVVGAVIGLVGGAIGVYQPTDATTFSLDVAIFAALAFSGHPLAGVACAVANQIGHELRKHLVFHLRAFNIVQQALSTLACFFVFDAISAGASVGSLRWAFAALLGMLATEAVVLLTAVIFDVWSELLTPQEALGMCQEGVRLVITITAGIAMLSSALVNTWFGWIALLLPVIFQHAVYSNAERAMRAVTESMRDPLTGLSNRRALTIALDEMMPNAQNDKRASSWVLLCDLDNFKQLNDTLGHEMGDEALRRAANQIRISTRPVDVCSRFGGEEFVILLSELSPQEVSMISERLRSGVERELGEFGTTVSIGVYPIGIGDDALQALSRADQAMYAAKTTGKNRVVFWSPETASLGESAAQRKSA